MRLTVHCSFMQRVMLSSILIAVPVYTVPQKGPKLGYNLNTHPPFFKNNFLHISLAHIQKSATGLTFSTTVPRLKSFLLNLYCSKAAVTEMTR